MNLKSLGDFFRTVEDMMYDLDKNRLDNKVFN